MGKKTEFFFENSVASALFYKKNIVGFFFKFSRLEIGFLFTINCVLLYWRHLSARLLYNDFDYEQTKVNKKAYGFMASYYIHRVAVSVILSS